MNAHVIKFRVHGPKACLDVAQALPVGELREGHHTKMIGALEAFDLVVSVVAIHAPMKMMPQQPLHELRKNRRSCVHPGLPCDLESQRLQVISSQKQSF